MTTQEFKEFCFYQHDVVCNQKYDTILPYSYHLDLVVKQVEKFSFLLTDDYIANPNNSKSSPVHFRTIVILGAYCHDVIEDGRLTYNDILSKCEIGNYIASEMVAEIAYLCTDYKGRDRNERKPQELYIDLAQNKLAVFVKLCDIIANSKYSLLQNSSMLKKYKEEYYSKVKPHLYTDQYKEMFNYLEKIYEFV